MKYYLKQKLISWFDSYNIYDENENIIYVIKGEMSWGHQLRIYDKEGNELGLIKEKILTLLPKFTMYDKDENEIGMVCKEFSFLKPKYNLTCNDWNVVGDFLGLNYRVVDSNNVVIASVTKKLLHLTDTYEIEVENEENSLLAIMIVLSIDIDKCTSNNSNNINNMNN